MKNCLLRLHADLKDFDTSEVTAAAEAYRSRGKADQDANVAAIEDHLRDLRQQRARIEVQVLEAWQERDPEGHAKLSRKEQPALELTGETEAQIKQREALEKKAAEDKAKKDNAPASSEFTLTGSDRPVDVAEAHGQKPLFKQDGPTRGEAIAAPELTAIAERLGLSARIADTEGDLPAHLLKQIEDESAQGEVRGVFDPTTGDIWLVRQNIGSEAEAVFVALHESAHRGLGKLFGKDVKSVLERMYHTNKNVRAAADKIRKAHGYDLVRATEEVVADMALRGQAHNLKGWERFVELIRKWLVDRGFNINVTDGMAEFIAGAAAQAGKDGVHVFAGEDAGRFHRAYHGSPHDFDKFDISKIGTGEGAQAYGHGLYFAGKREVAQHYKEALSKGTLIFEKDGQRIQGVDVLREYFKPGRVVQGYGGLDRVLAFNPGGEHWAVKVEEVSQAGKVIGPPRWHSTVPDPDRIRSRLTMDGWADKRGRLYEVELAPKEHEYLDWDKPLSEQSPEVRESLAKVGTQIPGEELLAEAKKQREDAFDRWNASYKEGAGTERERQLLGEFQAAQRDEDRLKSIASMRGEEIYHNVAQSDREASARLSAAGIPGIKYRDGSSRDFRILSPKESTSGKWVVGPRMGDKAQQRYFDNEAEARAYYDSKVDHNYVLFDDKHVEVKAKFSRSEDLPGVPPEAAPPRPPQRPQLPLEGGTARNQASWDAPAPSKLDDFIYSLQNKHIDTKKIVTAIRDAGRAIADRWNPYLQEELYHGRTAKLTQDFAKKELQPLLADMAARGVAMDDFEKYLHARHAEERNQQIARVNPDMPDGGSGMTTEAARDYLETIPEGRRKALDALARKVDAITKRTREMLIEYGLEAPETISAWESTYEHYVPLMREDADHGGGMGTGQGYSVKGSSSKRATGSSRSVVDIIANVALQRERAVTRGEKNRVALALYGLAKLNPNSDFWKVDQPPTIRDVSKQTGLVENRVDPLYKSRDNVVTARIYNPKKGAVEELAVVFDEGDERAMRMAHALKNLDADQLGHVLGASAKVTRYFASINTQYNPVFGIINLTRDVQSALLNLSTTPLRGKKAEVLQHTISALRGIYIDLRDTRDGKEPTSAWANLWEEFQREGGQTGYRDMFASSKERGAALEDELKRITEGKAKQAGRAVFDWLSDYNAAGENAVRLAAYRVAKDSGMTNQQAASLAKNLTVNFNRKGQVALQAGALYAFFNASAQGSARTIETLTGPAGKKIVMGGLLLGAMQALAMSAAGFDDDEPPQFVREKSIVIPIGNKKYIAIPMPQGFNVIPNISRTAMEYVLSGFKSPGKRIANLAGTFADSLNPIGNAGLSLQTIAPTAIDPLAAIAENKDWTGRPIAKEDRNPLAPTPGSSRTKDTASWWGKQVAEAVNLLTGGTKYTPGALSPTPDQIDYLIGQGTGGVGRELSKFAQAADSARTGDELPTYKLPLVGRVYGDAQGQAQVANKFYANLKTINEHQAEIKGRIKDRQPIADYVRENPEARLTQAADQIERHVSELRKEKRALIERDADVTLVRLKEVQITTIMRRFNERVDAVRTPATAG